MRLLGSRHFFRHQDRQNRSNRQDWCGADASLDTKIGEIGWCHILMSYAHMTSNDAYDINIWHWPISPILVSKEASGPQQSHLLIRFWLKNCFKIQKLKNVRRKIFLYRFLESFVFSGPKRRSWRQHFPKAFRPKTVFGPNGQSISPDIWQSRNEDIGVVSI